MPGENRDTDIECSTTLCDRAAFFSQRSLLDQSAFFWFSDETISSNLLKKTQIGNPFSRIYRKKHSFHDRSLFNDWPSSYTFSGLLYFVTIRE